MDNFPGNNKHPDYVKIVNNMLWELRPLDVFPGIVSETEEETFHQYWKWKGDSKMECFNDSRLLPDAV